MLKIPEDEIPQIILRVQSADNELGGGHVAAFKSLAVALMDPPPEVVTWGSRTFVFKSKRSNEDLIYVEALSYPLMEGVTCFVAKADV